MSSYLVVITGTNDMAFPKSALEREVYKVLLEQDRALISEKALPTFKEKITKAINKANAQHPDITPMNSTWTPVYKIDQHQDHSIRMGAGRSCTFKLYKSR